MTRCPASSRCPPSLPPAPIWTSQFESSHKQVTTQPSLVAKMVQALALHGHEKVLEVGTGYGYQTALLAMLAREVWSIELWQDMIDAARTALVKVGVGNATLLVGDGTRGLPEQAPFDAIIVTAAFPTVPPPLARPAHTEGVSFSRSGPAAARTCACSRRRTRSWWRCGASPARTSCPCTASTAMRSPTRPHSPDHCLFPIRGSIVNRCSAERVTLVPSSRHARLRRAAIQSASAPSARRV